MLNDKDVELIRSTRADVIQHRLKPFFIVREVEGEEDPYTGNFKMVAEQSLVYGTWSPLTGSGTSGTDFEYVDGVQIMSGDIKADVSLSYDLTNATHVIKDGVHYTIAAIEKLGLGEDNRYFLLLRRLV